MKAMLKAEIAQKRGADSAALAVLDMLVHSFASEGDFRVVVSSGKQVVGTTEVRVRKDGTESQVDIDLADIGGAAPDAGCGCDGEAKALQPGGYAVFYVSRGDRQYVVRVFGGDGKDGQPIWDSTTLHKGDVFATTLVRAGEYVVVNRAGTAKTSLHVVEPERDSSVLRENVALTAEVDRDAFRPVQLKLVLGQGISFRAAAAARVVIELTHEDETREKGPLWRLDRSPRAGREK